MICGVGGKENFQKFFSRDIEKAIYAVNAFSRIVIIIDRDNRSIEDIECSIQRGFGPFFSSIKNREWKTNTYNDKFGIEQMLESMLLIIPIHQQGALETVMLSAISENPYDAKIVNHCGSFVKQIRPDAADYISTDRLELKAHLSTVWAIQSPEKVFDFINDQIDAVAWENMKRFVSVLELLNQFNRLMVLNRQPAMVGAASEFVHEALPGGVGDDREIGDQCVEQLIHDIAFAERLFPEIREGRLGGDARLPGVAPGLVVEIERAAGIFDGVGHQLRGGDRRAEEQMLK